MSAAVARAVKLGWLKPAAAAADDAGCIPSIDCCCWSWGPGEDSLSLFPVVHLVGWLDSIHCCCCCCCCCCDHWGLLPGCCWCCCCWGWLLLGDQFWPPMFALVDDDEDAWSTPDQISVPPVDEDDDESPAVFCCCCCCCWSNCCCLNWSRFEISAASGCLFVGWFVDVFMLLFAAEFAACCCCWLSRFILEPELFWLLVADEERLLFEDLEAAAAAAAAAAVFDMSRFHGTCWFTRIAQSNGKSFDEADEISCGCCCCVCLAPPDWLALLEDNILEF